MYEIFEKLLQKFGVTAYQVSKATGISQSTLSSWKTRGNVISGDKLQKIANYFGVSVDYMLGGGSLEDIIDEYSFKKNVGLEELSKNTNIPIQFIKNIGNSILCDEKDWDYLEKISDYLDIPIDKIKNAYIKQLPPVYENNTYSTEEDFKDLIEAYKNSPDMQPAVNKLLGLDYKK